MKNAMDEDNRGAMAMVKGKIRKLWKFSINEFGKNIGCIILNPNFGIGGSC